MMQMRIAGLEIIIAAVFIILAIYLFLPEIFLHFLGIGSWKRQYSSGVTLTFDDGPDPSYTPKILDILAKNNLKATFFLVGEKAEKYPDLVLRINREGHKIGSHCYKHKHAWTMFPKTTWEMWEKSMSVLKSILGKEPELIRPPWGGFNLALFIWFKKRNKKAVVWNAEGHDWQRKRNPHQIIERILNRTNEGTIVLLHDSGGDVGAPQNTILALEELCLKINNELKLPVVPLEFPNWSLARRISFRIWEKWEHFYAWLFKIKRIDHNNLFRLSLTRYRGPDLYNEEGQLLAKKGDLIGEIHFDNIRFQSQDLNVQKIGLNALRKVRLSLPSLAKYISENPEFKEVKVYIGITMLNKGAKGLGFTVEEYPLYDGHIIGFFQKVIMHIYHPAGNARKTESLGTKPKLVWISRDKLIEKYHTREKYVG